jgi:hypothetical protein
MPDPVRFLRAPIGSSGASGDGVRGWFRALFLIVLFVLRAFWRVILCPLRSFSGADSGTAGA